MPNSWHNAVNDFSPRLAVTTKLTRCSRTSIVFHGIDRYAPALAALARECKGCLETFRKGCHETEHKKRDEWGALGLAKRLRGHELFQGLVSTRKIVGIAAVGGSDNPRTDRDR